jgi:hypothetical protein
LIEKIRDSSKDLRVRGWLSDQWSLEKQGNDPGPHVLEAVQVRDLVEFTTRCGLIGADASGGNLRVEIVFAFDGMAGETAE